MIDAKEIVSFIAPYRVDDGARFRLKEFDPGDTGPFDRKRKEASAQVLQGGIRMLSELQEKLYAENRAALLMILQAMDAAGKDSTIKHVMSGVNPQGCSVVSFQQPSEEELDHDFLWRCNKALPGRGRIGIFNRSYYEEVLIVRVHPELLQRQKLPASAIGKDIWERRFDAIRHYEKHLTDNGMAIRKFFLHLSPHEQKRRFLKRLENWHKTWKFSMADASERRYWDDYMAAYEAMIRATAQPHAPWFVVPADHKWFTRLVVAGALVDALREIGPQYPIVDDARRKAEFEALAKVLDREHERASEGED